MPILSDYEFTQDLYHNNYASTQQTADGLMRALAAGDQKKINFFQGLVVRLVAEEEKVFNEGVAAAGGNPQTFIRDVFKNYPDMKDSAPFKLRLQQAGLAITESGLAEAAKINSGSMPKLSIAQVAGVFTSAIADYKEASRHIHEASFNYLAEDARNEYPHVYASAKLLNRATLGLNSEFEYSMFSQWAIKSNLHAEDFVKLDPTPVTQHNINQGLPASGHPNLLTDLEI